MSDSDQKPNNRRKLFAIIVLIALLILGWVVFAPGDDKKDANDNTKKTSQQDKQKKEENKDAKVEAANTDEPSDTSNPADGYVTTYTPPKVQTASTTPTPTTQTPPATTPEQPAPQNPTTPDEEEPTEPTCIVYEGQTITLKPGEVSDCYVITGNDEEGSCWVPEIFAYDDESEPYNWSDKPLNNRPYVVIQNADPYSDDEGLVCPTVDTQFQFHVVAPEGAASTEQPVVDYDYALPVIEFTSDTENPIWHDVNVNIDDTTPVEL